ncbi:MAG: AI-2E family transporter [Kistimonas sp.]|nr:AI-2E family transporter [Kistimonas sp.]
MQNITACKIIGGWIQRYFSSEEALAMLFLLAGALAVILLFGSVLAPVIASLVLAFILQGLVSILERLHCPRGLAVNLVFLLFMALFIAVFLLVLPLVWDQGTTLLNELPRMVQPWRELLSKLPEAYPGVFSEAQVHSWSVTAHEQLSKMGRWLLSVSLATLPNILALLVYLVLIPILVFFFLKDRQPLMQWFVALLPSKRRMIDQVGAEMSRQIANYIRGKALEIVIVGASTFALFAVLNMRYAALLGSLVGLSVVVPFIGAVLVTLPVIAVGLFQWGLTDPFFIMLAAYSVLQIIDGNVLVPLLFSEAVNLHPVAIIVAVLFFGGLWGGWGVFFAIPLAALVKAVATAWPARA